MAAHVGHRGLTLTLTTARRVAWCRDGGHQERDAATRFVKKVFPSAEVTATQTKERPITVRTSYQGEETDPEPDSNPHRNPNPEPTTR